MFNTSFRWWPFLHVAFTEVMQISAVLNVTMLECLLSLIKVPFVLSGPARLSFSRLMGCEEGA